MENWNMDLTFVSLVSNWSWLESDEQTQNLIIFGNGSHVLNSVECGWGTKTMFYPSLIFSFCYDFLLMIVLHVVFFVVVVCNVKYGKILQSFGVISLCPFSTYSEVG